MYQNNQLELLINAYEGSIPHDITLIIAKIQSIYKAYNADYSRYTQNYISMMESAFNDLKTAQLIPVSKGGTLHTTKPIDSEKVVALLSDYYDKLLGLRYLKFLSEEKKTVVFVGPNGCGKTTLLRNLIHATGENQISISLPVSSLRNQSHIILLMNLRTTLIHQLSPNYGISLRNTVKEAYSFI